jgi:hypothetical protein
MIVQVNTDRNIEGSSERTQRIEATLRGDLERFGDRITRIEVHLRDRNSDKKGGSDDMDCLLEARLAGFQPLAVSHRAATVDEAVDGAVGKLKRSIESTLGRAERR